MSEIEHEEMIIPIGEMLPGDKVLSSSGEWIKARLLPVQTKQMYRVLTSAGAVDCSFDHQWTLFENPHLKTDLVAPEEHSGSINNYSINSIVENLKEYSRDHNPIKEVTTEGEVLSTVEIYNSLEKYHGWSIGLKESGVVLLDVVMLEEEKCRCLEVDAEDHQFVILAERATPLESGEINTGDTVDIKRGVEVDDGEIAKEELLPLISRNCQTRLVAGRLSQIASSMALGDSSATTIDGTHKGAGIVSVNNVKSNVQYYYAEENLSTGVSWIRDWYRDHGMNDMGYPLGESLESDLNDVFLGEDLEEFSLSDSDQHFEFDGTTKDVINRKDQHFEEI